jgi:hypothetical protein
MAQSKRLEELLTDLPSEWRDAYRKQLPSKDQNASGVRAKEIESALNWAEKYYVRAKEHGNPLDLWFAYRTFRARQLQLPEWLLTYFDVAANALLSLIHERPENPDRATAAAFLMHRRGRGTVFSGYQNLDELLASAEVSTRLAQGDKKYIAVEESARAMGKSKKTVMRMAKVPGLRTADKNSPNLRTG